MKKSVLMIPALCMMVACSNPAKEEPVQQAVAQPQPVQQEVVQQEAINEDVAQEPAPAIVETAARPTRLGGQQQQANQQRATPPTVESIVERTFTFDADGDGKLSFAEFKASEAEALARRRERMGDRYDAAVAEEGLKTRFERYDTDKDGFLTKEELTAGLEAQRQQMRQGVQGQRQGGQGVNRPQGQGGNRQGGQGGQGGQRGQGGGNRAPRNP